MKNIKIPFLVFLTFSFIFLCEHGSAESRPNRGKQELEACMKSCKKEDAAFAKRGLDIIKSVENGSKTINEIGPELVALDSDIIDHAQKVKNIPQLLEAYSTAIRDLHYEAADSKFARKVHDGIKKLTRDYPKNAEAFNLLGTSLSLKSENEISIIEAYYRCLKIDRKHSACRTGYNKYVSLYQLPKCERDSISQSFGFYLGSSKKSDKFPKEIINGKEPYFVENYPRLDKNGIHKIVAIGNESERAEVEAVLTESAAHDFAELTRTNKEQELAIVLDDKVLSNPVIRDEISSRAIRVMEGADATSSKKSLFDRICSRPARAKLPSKLKL